MQEDYEGTERRAHCPSHVEMVKAHETQVILMEGIRNDLKWHNRIGYAIFIVGCTVIVIGLLTIFNAGMLKAQVENNTRLIERHMSEGN